MTEHASGSPVRVRVDYADHHEAFAPFLPRSGFLVGQRTDAQGHAGWWLLALDEPFDYQLKVGEPFQFRLVRVQHVLLRSRAAGQRVGEARPAPVFILLVAGAAPVPDGFDPAAYIHVAWGTATTEG